MEPSKVCIAFLSHRNIGGLVTGDWSETNFSYWSIESQIEPSLALKDATNLWAFVFDASS